ncbi:6-phosphogluconolactonase [Microlunatus sp. Y2014]|uniref:6-phosphogluconolactonase n=1 Tax=Microlunatus sp. Y2014 TaxID=3418488 RepID=UPI003DA76CBA
MPGSLDVLATAEEVADALAGRIIAHLAIRLTGQSEVHVALTGGTIATAAYERLAAHDTSAIDWSRVHLWWGDERFVPLGDPDRNDEQARVALGPLWEHAVRHQAPAPSPGADPAGPELDAAATAYAQQLGDRHLDLCLLGAGPDGHVASLFPRHPSLTAPGQVIAVRDSPKPPPERVSFSLPVINRSRQVWLTVVGAEKAPVVAAAHGRPVDPALGDGPLPCTRVTGTERTEWLVDRAAAQALTD